MNQVDSSTKGRTWKYLSEREHGNQFLSEGIKKEEKKLK